jgi:hypothetical protein
MSDFLKQMDEAGGKLDGGGSGLGCIGQMKVEFGFHGYPKIKGSGLDFWFAWRPASSVEDAERAKMDCEAKLKEHGVEAQARFGIKVTVFKEALTGPYNRDLAEFIAKWQRDSYKMILDALNENDIPANKVFWGQTVSKANPYNVAKGEAGKTDTDQNDNPRYPTIRVPVKAFENEAAAREFFNSQGGESDSTIQWSEAVKTAFGAEGPNETLQAEILKWYTEATKGNYYANDKENYPGLPGKPTESEAKEYIAGIYDGIEIEDIDTILDTFVPF